MQKNKTNIAYKFIYIDAESRDVFQWELSKYNVLHTCVYWRYSCSWVEYNW